MTIICVIGLVLPGAGTGAAAADPRARLDEVTRELKETRTGLERVDGRRTATMADLEDSQARQAALDDKLQTLTTELGQAQTSLSDADTRLEQTTAKLVATERELDETRDDLAVSRDVFADRARASYMYGGSGPSAATTMFGLEDVSQFHKAVAYVRRVMAHDRQQIATVASLERQVQATAVELAALQDRRREERHVAAAERDRVAGLVSEQRDMRDQVAAEAERHSRILAELDEDKATHVALIDSLETESDKLEAELRRRAEEERRRKAEEERRRVAEERRRAEEHARQVAAAERRAEAERAARSAAAAPAPAPVAAPAPARAPAPAPKAAPSGWRRPSDGRISSGFGMRRHPIFGTGRMHTGVDFGAPMGAPIYAATDGVVVSAGWRGGYGLAVVVDHGGGVATLYAHSSRLNVAPGQRVSRGQVIAATGSTGQSTGPHLHFEVRVNGQPRDPMPYL